MTVAFLTTGDEIIHGDILNTNSQQLANILCSEGISLGLHLTCSDKEDDLLQSMDFLAKDHEILIITGGLGPTSDDRTRYALSKHVQEPLEEHREAIEHIKARLNSVDVRYTENNAQQALFPQKATLLPNPNGTAMGCILKTKTHTYILLPGPPRECMPMFNNYVLPELLKEAHSQKNILRWRLFGVPESQIAHLFDKALEGTGYATGYRLDTPYVEVKVRFPKGKEAEVREKVEPLIKPYIISPPDKSASKQLLNFLETWPHPVYIRDNVTGGILQSLIQTPKTRNIVSFISDDVCTIQFNLQGLKEYWDNQNAPDGKSKLTIEYQNKSLLGCEEHSIPCRSTMVRHFAAEWLSFRLFHLLNQLH